ncbi:hypothetical protein GQ55_6G063300 [Panicum hallii var. hallii]|uniref:F-box domain-containing protein n=1 Tax=Panicum hallii var. hallii TaxID=1504633 RepID=A0A2T7D4M7_9POAL|nr:hypothetical protein GQ55_6G063300 [Panicum hallii var. hallii]
MSEMDAAAACVPALPEDVVSEILARVPDVVSLFRCAAVCHLWRRLVADPAFLRRYRLWPAGCGTSLLGFFAQRHQLSVNARRKVSKLFPSRAPVLVPAPGSALGPGRRFLSSFVRDDAGILDQAKPVAARGGLLLVRVSHRPRDKITVLSLCVCDLLAGKRDLPPLDVAPFGDEGVRGYAVLTAADHGAGHHRPADGYSTFFQVLLTGVDHEDGRAFILKFSSAAAASRSWSCIQGSLAGPYGSRVAAVTRGTARAELLPLDMLPRIMRVDRSNVWLCLSTDERLSLIYLHNNHLWILTKKDGDLGGTGNWMCTRAVQVGVELGLFGMESLSMVSVGEKSGTVLALYHSDPDNAYSFNYMTAVAYEINWLEFFMSRLGVRQ